MTLSGEVDLNMLPRNLKVFSVQGSTFTGVVNLTAISCDLCLLDLNMSKFRGHNLYTLSASLILLFISENSSWQVTQKQNVFKRAETIML